MSGVRCPVSDVRCHVSCVGSSLSSVTCHMSLTATATDAPPANSPTISSRLVYKDPKIAVTFDPIMQF